MENLLIANSFSVFNLFGCGFLIGSIFAFVVMLGFEFVAHLAHKDQ